MHRTIQVRRALAAQYPVAGLAVQAMERGSIALVILRFFPMCARAWLVNLAEAQGTSPATTANCYLNLRAKR